MIKNASDAAAIAIWLAKSGGLSEVTADELLLGALHLISHYGIATLGPWTFDLEALGVDSDLAGLAKQDEEIYLPGGSGPVVLPKDSAALRVLVAVRDETHRFATSLNQKLRASDLRFGVLEEIEGVGPARARRLMREFGSLESIATATAERIAKAGGMGLEVAVRIKDSLAT